jgi:hypothetical protein
LVGLSTSYPALMLLFGALLVLLAVGLWMYGLIDVVLTPGSDCRNLRKGAWLAIAGLLFLAGAAAWLWFGRPRAASGRFRAKPAAEIPWLYGQPYDPVGLDGDTALRRHPAGRARQDWIADAVQDQVGDEVSEESPSTPPVGPDDDPEFLLYLDRVIRDIREAGNGA